MCFMPTSSTTLFQQQPQIFGLTLIGYYICLESSNRSSCSPIAHQYLPLSWRFQHHTNTSRLKSTVIFSFSLRDTSHATHRQFHSVNSCLQFGQICFHLHGGLLHHAYAFVHVVVQRIFSGFDAYLLDLEDCYIILKPSFMSSQYQHLPNACTCLQ